MNETLHPARSPEFLSRLHDGEVPASEAAAFAAHRAACAECHEAVEAFARSLAAFRSAEPAPAAADLSARILRKIRAQSPSRRPFGVMFGIDIRWAGVFVAALLVVLLSAPALLRRPEAPTGTAAPSSISARIVDAGPAKESVKAARPARADTRAEAAAASAPALEKAKDEAAMPAPAAPPAVVAEAPAEEEKSRPSSGAPHAKILAPVQRRQVTAAESVGGEAGASNAASAADAFAAVPRLAVRAVDGQGTPPALVSRIPEDGFASLRGQEFVLVVEAQGRVREVLPSSESGFVARSDARTADARPQGALDALRALRFSPGDRPRRLVVRVE